LSGYPFHTSKRRGALIEEDRGIEPPAFYNWHGFQDRLPAIGCYLPKEFWTGFHRQLHRCPVASHLGYRIPEAIVGIEPTQDCFAGSCLHTASSMALRSLSKQQPLLNLAAYHEFLAERDLCRSTAAGQDSAYQSIGFSGHMPLQVSPCLRVFPALTWVSNQSTQRRTRGSNPHGLLQPQLVSNQSAFQFAYPPRLKTPLRFPIPYGGCTWSIDQRGRPTQPRFPAGANF
jgi:hypothetical protein